MIIRRLVPLAAVVLVAVACSTSPPGIRVTNPRMPQPPAGDVAVVYMTIHNLSGDSDTLESATTPAAADASVHRTVRQGVVEEMLPAGPVTIAGKADFVLSLGGNHLMLEHLRSPLHEGDRIAVTLRFQRAGNVKVTVPVVAADAAATTNG